MMTPQREGEVTAGEMSLTRARGKGQRLRSDDSSRRSSGGKAEGGVVKREVLRRGDESRHRLK